MGLALVRILNRSHGLGLVGVAVVRFGYGASSILYARRELVTACGKGGKRTARIVLNPCLCRSYG